MSSLSGNDVFSSEKSNKRIIRCAAKTCCNNSSDSPLLKFFPFPKNATIARTWAKNAGREDILPISFFAMKRYALCADHFEDQFFNTQYERTAFKNNIIPIPTVFNNNLKHFNWRETKLFAMDDIKTYEKITEDNKSTDINVVQNDIYSNVEFGRLTYTDDLYEEFVLNPGVLSMKTDVSDRLIKRDYCRLCAKQLPIANLVPIFERGYSSYGQMLEMCLPGRFKENDKYPHDICSACIQKLEECCKIIKSFIEADKNIRIIFKNKETAARINDTINNPNSQQPVEDILNSFDDKSLIMISSDKIIVQKQEICNNNQEQIENKDEPYNNTDIIQNSLSNGNSLSETNIKNLIEQEKLKIKFQCINIKINDPTLTQGPDDILPDAVRKKQTEIEDALSLTIEKAEINTDDLLCLDTVQKKENDNSLSIDTNNSIENKNVQSSLVKEKPESSGLAKNTVTEPAEKLEIKYQCLTCLKLFNNKKEVTDHSQLTHLTKDKNKTVYRIVKAKLKKNNEIVYNKPKDINAEDSLLIKENSDINEKILKKTEEMETKFQCMICLKLYKTKKKVLEHSLAVHPTPGQNKIVFRLVKVKKKLEFNNKNKKPPEQNKKLVEDQSPSVRYECLLCSSHHRSKDTLIKHTHIHHPNLTNGKFLCRILKPKKYRSHKVTCLRCSESFESVIKYRKHMKKHVSFKCDECGMSFDKIYKLKNHRQTHKEPKIYNCLGCGEQFINKGDLYSHEEIHKQPKEEVYCPTCNKRFTSAYSLRKHRQCHESWLCNVCGKLFPNKLYLFRHIQIHSDERPYKCKVCHKSFKTLAVLVKHKECHESEKKYICQTCGKQFRTSGTLRQHMMIHSAVKKHACDICGSRFHRRGNLVKHREIHNYIQDDLYKCKICNKVLSNLNTYKFHLKQHKTTGDKKQFYCSICNKKFALKTQLQVHLRLHSGERPYKCDFCDKTFRSKASLNQHRLIHMDVFPHECDFCDRKFRRQQSLIVHRKTHTGERPFPCPICSRAFANRCDMIKHKKIHARKAALVNELNFNDESVNNADYMDYVDEQETESNILESILSNDDS